jgi:hypothetical protein
MDLLDYLLDISNNPRELRRFQSDTDAALAEAKLTDQAKAALKSGDPQLIQSAIIQELGPLNAAGAGSLAAAGIAIDIHIVIKIGRSSVT